MDKINSEMTRLKGLLETLQKPKTGIAGRPSGIQSKIPSRAAQTPAPGRPSTALNKSGGGGLNSSNSSTNSGKKQSIGGSTAPATQSRIGGLKRPSAAVSGALKTGI